MLKEDSDISATSLASLDIQKLYNDPTIKKNKEHLSKIICSQINNLDQTIKNPCSIFLVTDDNIPPSNNFLEDDVYFYLNLHEDVKVSVIEKGSPMNKKNQKKTREIVEEIEEENEFLADFGQSMLDLKVPESNTPKLLQQFN